MSLREYLAFKAGRAFRRGDTNFVDPSPTKGAIYVTQEEDGLVHFKWKNRETNEFVEDLIMFPGDASFVKVPTPSGRVYVLKFSSSAERHFFWMQTQSSLRDEDFARNLNRALEDADSVPVWMGLDVLEDQAASAGSSSQPGPPAASGAGTSSSSGGATSGTAGAGPTVTAEQAAQFRSLIASMTAAASGGEPAAPEYSLVDVLTPQTLRTLFTSNPTLASSLFPFLPPDLPEPPSLDVLQRVVSSPQFRQAVASLDRALRTGMLQDLVRGLGLPSEAGSGVEAFLRAISEQVNSQESSMDTE